MVDGIPVWAWLIATALGSGFVTAVAPPIIEAVTGRAKSTAEATNITADTMVRLHPVWNETVKFLQSEIDLLRVAAAQDRTEIERLRARLDEYEKLLAAHGVPLPD